MTNTQKHAAESENAAGQWICPFCLSKLERGVENCSKCQKHIEQPVWVPDQRYIDFSAELLVAQTKSRMTRWLQSVLAVAVAVFAIVGGIVVLLLGEVIELTIRNGVATVEEELNNTLDSAEEQMRLAADRAKRDVEAAQKKVSEIEVASDRINEHTVTGSNTLASELRTEVSSYAVSLSQLQSILSSTNTIDAIDRLTRPRPSLASPISLHRDFHETFFADSVRVYWNPPRLSPAKCAEDKYDSYSYLVEWSSDPRFENGKGWMKLMRETSLDIPVCGYTHSETTLGKCERSKNGCNAPVLGRVYWHVQATRYGEDTGESTPWSNVGSFEAYRSAQDRIRATNRVLIGVASDWKSNFCRVHENVLTGFDVELAKEIVAKMNSFTRYEDDELRAEFLGFDWNSLLTAPRRNVVDFIISTITIKKERETEYRLLFSDHYFETCQAIFWRKDAEIPQAIRDFEIPEGGEEEQDKALRELSNDFTDDLMIVVVENTTSFDIAKKLVRKDCIRRVATDDLLMQEVGANRHFIALLDLEIARSLRESHNNKEEHATVVEPRPIWAERYGIGVSQGQQGLLEDINLALRNVREEDSGSTFKRLLRQLEFKSEDM